MSTPQELKIDPEKVHEIPMVDLAVAILKKINTPLYYRDLMKEVAELRGFTKAQTDEYIAQLYTEINVDGRFACVGTNLWGLKRWYPLERAEDPIANAKRPRIINDEEDDDIEDEEFNNEDVVDADEPEDENYDAVDEDSDDIFVDGEDDDEDKADLVIDDEDDDDDEDEDEEYVEEDKKD